MGLGVIIDRLSKMRPTSFIFTKMGIIIFIPI